MHADDIRNIAEAILRLNAAFERAGLKPPPAIIAANKYDAQAFKYSTPDDRMMTFPDAPLPVGIAARISGTAILFPLPLQP